MKLVSGKQPVSDESLRNMKKKGGGGDSAHRFIMNGLSSWKQRKGSLATRENIAESDNRRLQKNRLNMAIWLLGDQKEDV